MRWMTAARLGMALAATLALMACGKSESKPGGSVETADGSATTKAEDASKPAPEAAKPDGEASTSEAESATAKPEPPGRPEVAPVAKDGPCPFEQRELVVQSGDVKLAGTLAVPMADSRTHPAVLILSGSGQQDRDGTLFGQTPYKRIAGHLACDGIASLRLGDRGADGSGGDFAAATIDDKAKDAMAALKALKAVPDIDAKRVGMLGHSEGGYVAVEAAKLGAEPAFVVLLSGPAIPGDQVLRGQLKRLLEAGKAPEEAAKKAIAAHKKLVDLVLAKADEEALRAAIEAQLEASMTPEQLKLLTPGRRKIIVDAGMSQVSTPSGSSFIRFDPTEALKALKVPVLGLFGELDLQVLAEPNAKALREDVPAERLTVKILPKHNHLFQEATTGLPQEYGSLGASPSDAALKVISGWLKGLWKQP